MSNGVRWPSQIGEKYQNLMITYDTTVMKYSARLNSELSNFGPPKPSDRIDDFDENKADGPQ
jgi:hypothetical protein